MANTIFVLSELSNSQKEKLLINLKSGADLIYLDNIILDDCLKVRGISVSSLSLDSCPDLQAFFHQVEVHSDSSGVFKNIPYVDTLAGSLLEPLFLCLNRAKTTLQSGGNIYVYCARYSSNNIPLMGFKTIEIPFGSRHLLGAYIGSAIKKSVSDKSKLLFYYRPRDILCFNFLRKSTIVFAEIIFTLNFLLKLIRLKVKLANTNVNIRKGAFKGDAFIVRTPLQMSYANAVVARSPDVGVDLVLIPQGRLGRLQPLIETLGMVPDNMTILVPSVLKVIWNVLQSLVHNSRQSENEYIFTFPNYNFSFSSKSINSEARCFLYESSYSLILKGLLRKNTKKIFNFSLKGRYAIFEKNVADLRKVPLATIQTANLDPTKSYNFPVSDFYCDSQITHRLGMKGFTSAGDLFYEGCPFTVKNPSIVNNIKIITFFTQPYEIDVNLIIIDFLFRWCEKNNSSIIVRLHPRDDKANYFRFTVSGQQILTFSNIGSAKEAIEMADVCITRTSAIGLEALAVGVPSIYCLFSDYDHSVKNGYINLVKNEKSFANNVTELEHLLDRPNLLNKNHIRLQGEVFAGKDIMSLSQSLLGK